MQIAAVAILLFVFTYVYVHVRIHADYFVIKKIHYLETSKIIICNV